jgi:DNA polymerase-4
MRIVMHIDVNSAFLSWTAVKLLSEGYKDIRNTYSVVVAGGRRHSMVLAKSMPAKTKGVTTGEPVFLATKKCPYLDTYIADYSYYTQSSDKFINLIRSYFYDIEQFSIDECYVEYTSYQKLYGDPIEFANKLKKEITDKLGITVNIGIGNNKLCAKMASDFTKPNKVHTCFMNEIETKLWPLPVGSLFGIGRASNERLKKLQINTIKDLADSDITFLSRYFKNQAPVIKSWANGIESSVVQDRYNSNKGIGNEITLTNNLSNIPELEKHLFMLSNKVASRLRNDDKYAKVVCVTLKDKKFRRYSHQKQLKNATNKTDEIYKTTKEILKEMDLENSVRLVGVRLEKLVDKLNYQVSLFEDIAKSDNDEALDKVIDKLKIKYGNDIIDKTSLSKKNQ